MNQEKFLRRLHGKAAQVYDRLRNTRLAGMLLRLCVWCDAHSFFVQCVLILLLRAALDVLYISVLSPNYAYSGFTTTPEPLFYLCSWAGLLVFLPFFVWIGELRSPSAMIVNFLNYLFFIPATSFAGCYRCDTRFFVILLVFWAFLIFFQLRLPVLYLKKPALHISKAIMIALTVFSCLFVLYLSGRYTGFRLTLNFTDEYKYRLEAREYSLSTIAYYLLTMIPVVLCILLAYWTACKRWLIAAALIVVYMLRYSFDTQKAIFLMLLLILACRFFYREWMLRWISGLMLVFTTASITEEKIMGTFFLVANFVRRLMYLPVLLCTQYDSFFQLNPQSLNRDGIMGKLSFHNIYSTAIPRIIGEYRGHPAENANTGLLGDLFANLPLFPGIVLLPLILVICFRMLDLTGHASRQRILVPLCFYYACSFLGGFWSTTLLSNGFLLTCILLYLYPDKEASSHV